MSRIPNPSRWPSKTLEDRVFVKGSARLSSDLILHTVTSPHFLSHNSDEVKLPVNVFFSLMASWFLAICNRTTIVTIDNHGLLKLGITSKSLKKLRSHAAFLTVSEAATYLASMVESETQDCFTLHHTMAPPFKVNTEPKVDFLKSGFDWKLESVYPTGIKSDPEHTSV